MDKQKRPDTCPYCGGNEWDDGTLMQKGTIQDIRYKSDNTAVLAMKQPIAARLCLSCGHLSLRILAR